MQHLLQCIFLIPLCLLAMNALLLFLPESPMANKLTLPLRAILLAIKLHYSYGFAYRILKFIDKASREGATGKEYRREAYQLSEHYPDDYDRYIGCKKRQEVQ